MNAQRGSRSTYTANLSLIWTLDGEKWSTPRPPYLQNYLKLLNFVLNSLKCLSLVGYCIQGKEFTGLFM